MPSSRRKQNHRRERKRFRRVFLEQLEDRSLLAAAITVNSVLDTNARDSALTLREAILISNLALPTSDLTSDELAQVSGTPTSTDADTIAFNIPGSGIHTINVVSALPTITESVTIDGYTQPGASRNSLAVGDNAVLQIELNGSGTSSSTDGLTITAGSSTVRGLVINRFPGGLFGHGIVLDVLGGNTITGNFLGTDSTGTLDRGNQGSGVYIAAGNGNVVGGTLPADRNVISGNDDIGIDIQGGSGHVVVGNYIGTDVTGKLSIGNALGIELFQTTGNQIGGAQLGAGNILSGNNNLGLLIHGSSYNIVQGNVIGLGADGTTPVANGTVNSQTETGGLLLFQGSKGNLIGGATPEARNYISGNIPYGILARGFLGSTGPDLNHIQGNYIGTDITGKLPRGNTGVGLSLGSANAQIGGFSAGEGNLISFNGGAGVAVIPQQTFTPNANAIVGNSISSNGGLGIDLGNNGVTANDAGDADLGLNNLQNFPNFDSISTSLGIMTVDGTLNSIANTQFRIEIFASEAVDTSGFGEGQTFFGTTNVTTDSSGNGSFTVTAPTRAGGVLTMTATRLNSQGEPVETSEFSGAAIVPVFCTLIVENTNDTGPGSLRDAITCSNASVGVFNTIRFDIPGSGVHTISPASALPAITDPVIIDGYSQPGARANTNAAGSGLGLNTVLQIELNGSLAGGNGSGLLISAGNSTVRGLVVNQFNRAGILLSSATGNHIEGNFIGTNADGKSGLGNGSSLGDGIELQGSSNNVIGGTAPAARNLISGSTGGSANGIRIANGANGNIVQGNLIGTDVTGLIKLGNGFSGVRFDTASGNIVGGTTDAARNVISGNTYEGIEIVGNASNNVVEGNYIGTDVTGTAALGNWIGVVIGIGALRNTVGGTTAGATNVIAYNGLNGVRVVEPSAGNGILSNSIYSNGGIGIDLVTVNDVSSGVTPNDIGDADTGPNNLQNYPVVSSASVSGATLSLQYAVPSTTANSAYPLRVEFFKADADSQEGQIFLGVDTYLAAEAATNKVFSFTPAIAVAAGEKIVATATDSAGNTSEFSLSQTVQSSGGQNSPPMITSNGGGTSASVNVLENTTAVTDVDATDPDAGTTLTYSINGGVDAAKFSINGGIL